MSSYKTTKGNNNKSIQMLIGRDIETNKFVVDAKCTIPATPRGNEQSQSGPSSSQRRPSFELHG